MFLLVPFLHPSILFFLAMVIKLSFFFFPFEMVVLLLPFLFLLS
jgi:hypothetical protein